MGRTIEQGIQKLEAARSCAKLRKAVRNSSEKKSFQVIIAFALLFLKRKDERMKVSVHLA